MTAITTAATTATSPAHRWFENRLHELTRRAWRFARRLPRGEREEAVAEILAQIFDYTLRAAARGKLHMLTPPTLVYFYGRGYMQGRRLAGSNGRDVCSRRCRYRHGLRIVSLDAKRRMRTRDGEARLRLSEILADRRAEQPFQNCRRDIDYDEILTRQKASPKARRVFRLLAETHGTARGVDVARQLRVSQPRIVQLKYKLADCLAAEQYGPWRTWVACRSRRGSRRPDPPLNAGTSPAPGRARG